MGYVGGINESEWKKWMRQVEVRTGLWDNATCVHQGLTLVQLSAEGKHHKAVSVSSLGWFQCRKRLR